MQFSEQILNWYSLNKRDLPWRNNKDPYQIWISEIILQQTKVIQGLPYYKKFISVFPTIKHLANAKEDEVLKLWQGLGYYSRARNLCYTAKEIVEKYNCVFPKDYNNILRLKGIGPYTAAAIISFAYNLPHAVVDGNVIRLLSRYFGISSPLDTTKGKKKFQLLAQELLIRKESSNYNQAIMEFGSIQCTPRSPNCNICDLQNECFAFNNNQIHKLPVKKNKIKIRTRYFNFLIISKDNMYLIEKRQKGIWKGLYQFPVIEFNKRKTKKKIIESDKWRRLTIDPSININKVSRSFKHQLTHQTIYARFWHLSATNPIIQNANFILKEDLKNYPIPKLLEKYLKSIGII